MAQQLELAVVVFAFWCAVVGAVEPCANTRTQLRFKPDGSFKILQLTDIHIEPDNATTTESLALISYLIDSEQPDLVVITGDTISGWLWPTGAWDAMSTVFDLLEKKGVWWANTLGNHDGEGDQPRDTIPQQEQEHYKHSLTQHGPKEVYGVTNYCLSVKSADNDTVGATLFLIDSNAYSTLGYYDWIHMDQIQWYTSLSQEIETFAGGIVPALAFFHIPIPEYWDVWQCSTCYGNFDDSDNGSPDLNSGFYLAAQQRGDIRATFVGHAHLNDYCGTYVGGLDLCFGRKTGYGCYGVEGSKKRATERQERDEVWTHGARVILLHQNPGDQPFYTTWLRLADGSTITTQPEHVPSGDACYVP